VRTLNDGLKLGVFDMDHAIREKTSASLYKFAWLVEIVAVLLGLGITLAVAADGWSAGDSQNSDSFSKYVSMFISSAPFFLVALVEFTKIPLSGAAYYATRFYWRVLFAVALFFVAFVTFETMFNGLERNFASLKYSIDVQMDEYTLTNERLGDLIEQRKKAEGLTLESIEESHNSRTEKINLEFDQAVIAVDKKYESEKLGTVDDYINGLQIDKKTLQDEITTIKNRHSIELEREASRNADSLAAARRELDGKRDRIEKQLARKDQEIRDANTSRQEASFFDSKEPFDKAIKEANAERVKLAAQLDQLINQTASSTLNTSNNDLLERHRKELEAPNEKLDRVSEVLGAALIAQRNGISELNKKISDEKAPFIAQKDAQLKEASERRKKGLVDLNSRANLIAELTSEITVLTSKITGLRGGINTEGRSNQVYRMAASLYNKDNISELSPNQVATVAAIWFGSLATIVAFTGILLALGSYALKTPPRPSQKNSSFISMMRKLIAAIMMVKRAPVKIEVFRDIEVVKEIEILGPERIVEKEIVKEVFVPGPERIVDREVKVREEIFIPVPATPSQMEALMELEKNDSAVESAA
jgi:hypothetical protein